MRKLLASGALLIALASAACGSVSPTIDAGPGGDGGNIDANTNPADAGIDSGVGPTGRPGNDLTNSGGRVSGGGYTVDVQLGHPFAQGPAAGGGTTIEGGAAIKP
jgi:hypothetical protein